MLEQNSQKGSVLGGILLVAGCSIGSAMLGFPILTGVAGFKPSIFMFVISWFFMLVTGLLFLEVNLWFYDEVSIISMADRTLGNFGKAVGWITFLFLFYSVMVAYMAGSGALVSDFVREISGMLIPEWVGSFSVMLLFGALIYFGTFAVDYFNRILMVGMVITYVLLVAFGIPYVNTDYLLFEDWSIAASAIPVMVVSFGYHNLVPSLTTYLHGDVKKLRTTIIVGSLIPLIVYLIWEYVILGIIPVEGGFRQALDEGEMATRALRKVVGASWIADLAEYFFFFTIITSLLTVALSFVDFLADGLHVKKDGKGKVKLLAMTLLPPYFFALVYPKVFLHALGYAGAFGAVVLFGLLPAAMVWSGRYREKLEKQEIVPGGKFTLIFVMLFSFAVMGFEIYYIV